MLFKTVNLAIQANIQLLWVGLRLVYFVPPDFRSNKKQHLVLRVPRACIKHNLQHQVSFAKAVRRVDILIRPRRIVLDVRMVKFSHHTINHTQVVFFVWLAFRLCRQHLTAWPAKPGNIKHNPHQQVSFAKAVVKAKVLRRQLQLVWRVIRGVSKIKPNRPFMVVLHVLSAKNSQTKTPSVRIVLKANTKKKILKQVPLVNFVPLEELLKTKRNPAPLALMDSTKTATLNPPPSANRVVLDSMSPVLPPYARIATRASFKNWPNQLNTSVNSVSLEQPLQTQLMLALVALVDSTKTATPKPPQFVKRVVLDSMPPVLPPYVRIARRARSKNWPSQLNTSVNFVSLEQLIKTQRNPAPLVLMGSTKTATPKPPPRAKYVVLDSIPSVPPPYASNATRASFKNWLKQSNMIVNFVSLVKHLHLLLKIVRLAHMILYNHQTCRYRHGASHVQQGLCLSPMIWHVFNEQMLKHARFNATVLDRPVL